MLIDLTKQDIRDLKQLVYERSICQNGEKNTKWDKLILKLDRAKGIV